MTTFRTQDKTHTNPHKKKTLLVGTYASTSSGKNYDNQFLHHKEKFETGNAHIINSDSMSDLETNQESTLEEFNNPQKTKRHNNKGRPNQL